MRKKKLWTYQCVCGLISFLHFFRSILGTSKTFTDEDEQRYFINKAKKVLQCSSIQEAQERFNSIASIWPGTIDWCNYFNTPMKLHMLVDVYGKNQEPGTTNGVESSHSQYQGRTTDELI